MSVGGSRLGGTIGLLAIAAGLLAFGVVAGAILYHGLASGCVKAKYGYSCLTDAPVRYSATIILTAIAGLTGVGAGILAAALAIARLRPDRPR